MTLVCGLAVEERIARKSGARSALVGMGATLPLPDGPLVSFGLSGGLADDLEPGTVLTAERIVDPDGRTLWEGTPLVADGALPCVLCWSPTVVDEPGARRALAGRSGAVAVDMESGVLAASGRLAGAVRAVSDTGRRPVGALARAGRADGGTDWKVVAGAFAREPARAAQAARDAARALAALRRAASSFVVAARP